jgi:hypothetical protein
MFTVTASAEIHCPPDRVFGFAGDYANDPAWRAGVLAMTCEPPGPPARGTRTRETMRSMGRTVVTVGEVVEFSPGRTAFRSISGPVPCEGSREFLATPAGTTRFTYTLTLRPTGLLGLLAPILRSILAKQVRADVARLRQRLESAR